MKDETLGEKIKRLREEKGWTSSYRLGKESGVAPSYIGRIERGIIPKPGYDIILRIAKALGVSVDELITDSYPGLSLKRDTPEILMEVKRLLEQVPDSALKFLGEVAQIPIKGLVPAGYPIAAEQQEGGVALIPRDDLQGYDLNRLYALTISGESLQGDNIHSGDKVVISPTNHIDVDGKIYVLRIANECTVKHVFRVNGNYHFLPSNPDYPELIPVDKVEILGRVIYIQPEGKAV